MVNVKDILQDKDTNDSCFSGNYDSIVSRLLSKCGDSRNADNQHGLVCDVTAQETKTKRIKEELVRCIWYGRHYKKKPLLTEDGSRLEIISPGGWNVEGGPDFHHAEILFSNGGIKKGDVEIHVYASDWNRHGHNMQETYNNVCLHVSMWNERKDAFVYSKDGHSIPQLVLNKYLDADLDELFDTIDIREYPESIKTNTGPCRKSILIGGLNSNRLEAFLDYAGDKRILSKAKRFRGIADNGTFEQALYEAIMEALGYKNNKTQFLELAKRVTFNDVQEIVPVDLENSEQIVYIQSLLLGMAGLLPSQLQKQPDKPDDETVNYIKRIEGVWESAICTRLKNKPMDGKLWKFSNTRPSNFPTRRLAAMGHITAKSLSNGGLLKLIIAVFERAGSCNDNKKQFDIIAKGIGNVFLDIFDDYWSYHYTFNGKRSSKAERLIGKERTSAILINIIIPILLISARKSDNIGLEEMLHLVFKMHPRLPANNITKFMTTRIFGDASEANKMICNVRRQQGLHQIFKDFCDSDNFLCDKCALYFWLNS
ncbi:MAG: DUF2851 family protein [Candidatus Anammoxibacter sp.]